MQKSFVEVILTNCNIKPLFYSVPDVLSDKLGVGMLVTVPIKGRTEIGFVIKINTTPPKGIDLEKILDIKDLLSPTKYFDEKYLSFFNFSASYYSSNLKDVIRASFPKLSLIKKTSSIKIKTKNPLDPVMEFIAKNKNCTIEKILKAFPNLEYKHIHELQEKGFIEIDTSFMYKKIFPPLEYFKHEEAQKKLTLNEEQENFLFNVINNLNKPKNYLLTGKTGSGKTEALIKLSDILLKMGYSVLYLVPEIALASYIYKKMSEVIDKDKIFIWHSSLPSRIRGFTFEKIVNSENIVIGTRSSVFLPIKNPGLIIVDEEHDASYKHEGSFPYNARDLAIVRGKIFSHPVILSSATPSMETLHRAKEGYYSYVFFKERFHPKKPEIIIVDSEKNKLINGFFSYLLLENIESNLTKNEQSLIFINRRGYVPYVYCNECKNFILCKFCTVPLTWHKRKNILTCHKCGYTLPFQTSCLVCNSDKLSFLGAGTEKIAEMLSHIFPSAKIIKIDRESTERIEFFKKELSHIIEGKYDIIVSTQILTKGHHFPKLTLVGVLLGDQGLSLPDFRAQERTFQLLTQVFGRTGRELPGRVIIQTSMPDAPAIKYAINEDIGDFYEYEIDLRKQTFFPPVSRLLIIKVLSLDEDNAIKTSRLLYESAKKFAYFKDLQIFEPVEAPIYRERGYYKMHIYCKSVKAQTLVKLSSFLKNSIKQKNSKIYFDIDPVNLI
ncbi:MAG: primosomal protein N' [Proteobacteria bacterium]|nr:primosomal protein N' [Pseudomonadota bacterium]